MGKIWLNPNPNANNGGGEGGGTPSSIQWEDIKDKPTEFIPTEHTHIIADIEELPEVISALKEGVVELEGEISLIIGELEETVKKEEGKGLSTNDFTDELLNELKNNSSLLKEGVVISVNGKKGEIELLAEDVGLGEVLNVKQASAEEFNEFQELVFAELENKVTKEVGKGLSTNDFSDELKSTVISLDNEVERILELLGEGGEVAESGIIKVIKKGHLYSIGNTIYDIINRNKVTGLASYRYVYDNIHLFENSDFQYNELYINVSGNLLGILDDINSTNGFWDGALTNIFNTQETGDFYVEVNGKKRDPQEVKTVYKGNRIYMDIGSEFFDENQKVIGTSSIVSNLNGKINTAVEKNLPILFVSHIVNNDIIINAPEKFEITVNQEMSYSKEEAEKVDQLIATVHFRSNRVEINEKLHEANFHYKNENANVFEIMPGVLDFKCAGFDIDIAFNDFNSEIARRYKGELTYLPERMEDPDKPLFNNVTLKHYANKSLDTKVTYKLDTNEIEKTTKAHKETPAQEVALRNTVIVEDLANIPKEELHEGLIAIVIEK